MKKGTAKWMRGSVRACGGLSVAGSNGQRRMAIRTGSPLTLFLVLHKPRASHGQSHHLAGRCGHQAGAGAGHSGHHQAKPGQPCRSLCSLNRRPDPRTAIWPTDYSQPVFACQLMLPCTLQTALIREHINDPKRPDSIVFISVPVAIV